MPAPVLDSVERARLLRSAESSVEEFDQNTIKKMLEVKVVPEIRQRE